MNGALQYGNGYVPLSFRGERRYENQINNNNNDWMHIIYSVYANAFVELTVIDSYMYSSANTCSLLTYNYMYAI